MSCPTFLLRVRVARQFSTSSTVRAGHNKWSKIKDKKGVNDTHKSVLYGNANRDIIVAARTGGTADPNQNAHLATILKKYKDQGVPRENIDKALSRAGKDKGAGGESVTYEAMAFGSVGIITECLTDNSTRTLHNVRHVLTRHDARMAPVKFMFQRKGCVKIALDRALENCEQITENLIEVALLADADDFDQQVAGDNEETIIVKFVCTQDALARVTGAVTSFDPSIVRLQSSELVYSPTEASESSEELDAKVSALVEELEADEDIIRVWTSLDSW